MSLVPCRACGHQVDTSALACPGCGATDPGRKISRQKREVIHFAIQLTFWLIVLAIGARFLVHAMLPMAKQFLSKPAIEQSQDNR